MPAVSEAQRKLLNARFGHDWVKKHHFDNTGKLPDHVPKKKKTRTEALLSLWSKKDKNGKPA